MSPTPPPASAPVEEQQPEKVEESRPEAEAETNGDVEMEAPAAEEEPEADEEDKADSKPESSKAKPKSAPKSSGRTGPGSKAKAKTSSSKTDGAAFAANDIVLAKLKGYPKWPAKIVADEDIPLNVQEDRAGKGSHCVRFFPVGDYAWLGARDIAHLKSHEISAFLGEGTKKKGDLYQAYQIAADPSEWEAEKDAEREAAEAEAAEEEEGVDELEDGDEAETGGKRKRAEPKKDAKKKKAKTETAKKAKKADSGDEAPASKKKATKAKATKADKKPVSAAEDEEADPLEKDPEAVRVKEWRHKLQRAFLGKGLPGASEMETYSELFTTIEDYGDKMTIPYLQHSKIGKVMKKIALLKDLPNDDEFKITSRASALMDSWSKILEPGAANGDKPESKTAAEPVKENGEEAATEAEPAAAETATETEAAA